MRPAGPAGRSVSAEIEALLAAALQPLAVVEGSALHSDARAQPVPLPPPPLPPPPAAPPQAARQRRRRALLPAAGWHVDSKYDSLYWTLASFVWWTYAAKLLPQLRWQENAQNCVMGASVVGMAVLSTLRPEAYRRHGPVLRLLLLLYGFSMPVLTSLEVMNAFTPAPSQIPYLGGLVDTYSLWLSTRNAFLAWALLGCRPPLHIAVPLQLFGLWRITAAGFCAAPVLQHSVMQERTESTHMLLSLTYSAASAGHRAMHALYPPTPYQRCSALLLFYNCIFAVLVPLLLLVPLRHAGEGGGGTRTRAQGSHCTQGWRSRADGCIEACLRPLMWPALLHTGADPSRRRDVRRRGAAAADAMPELPAFKTLLLRGYLLLMVLWTFCCLLQS